MELPANFLKVVQDRLSQLSRDRPKAVLEIEARPRGGVNATRFHRALELAGNSLPMVEKVVDVDTITQLDGKKRARIRERHIGTNVLLEVLTKETLVTWDTFNLQDYGIRLDMAVEETFSADSVEYQTYTQPREGNLPSIRRVKSRISFREPNSPYQFDFSHVVNTSLVPSEANQPPKDTYEIEVEIVQLTTPALTQFSQALKRLFNYVFESSLVYTMARRREMFHSVNQRIGSVAAPNDQLDLEAVTQARNLVLNDLNYGGLVPKAPVQPGLAGYTDYLVTVKADGNRKFLVIEPDGIWIMGTPDSLNYLSSGKVITLPEAKWIGAVFECEEIPGQQRLGDMKNYAGIYLVLYDCLFLHSEQNIRQRLLQDLGTAGFDPVQTNRIGYGSRMDYVTNFVAAMDPNNPVLLLSSKLYMTCHSPDDFYRSVNYLLDQLTSLPYKNDGLIFSPNGPYMPTGTLAFGPAAVRNNTVAKGPRILARYTDVVKWKPRQLNTFDLIYKDGQLWAGGPKGSLVLFHPEALAVAELIPENGPGLTPVLDENVVYEIGWDFELNRGRVYRPRRNKSRPNNVIVAEDAWRTAFNPIEETTLRGFDLVLMRRYHNREKRLLINRGKGLLLDLGSGRGGDLSKWANYSHIVAIEPSEANRVVFLERLPSYPEIASKVELKPGRAQDTDLILGYLAGKQADTITMMMSLTFLFESAETLQGLVNTIDKALAPGGHFLITVLDGDLVAAAYSLYPTEEVAAGPVVKYPGTRLVFPLLDIDIVLRTDPVSKANDALPRGILDITLGGTIVEQQTEFLTNMKLLAQKLNQIGLNLQSSWILDGERFLNVSEAGLSRLYSAWDFVRGPVVAEAIKNRKIGLVVAAPTSHLSVPVGSNPVNQTGQRNQPTVKPNPVQVSLPNRNQPNQPTQPVIMPSRRSQRAPGPCDPLVDQAVQEITSPQFPDEVFRRIGCLDRGNSCMLHAMLRGFDPAYFQMSQQGAITKRQRENYVQQIRQTLAANLTPQEYSKLVASTFARDDPYLAVEFSRESLQRQLNSNDFLGEGMLDYFSNTFDIDIYIMACQPQTNEIVLYRVPAAPNTLYKRRLSLILLYNGSHYETLEVKRGQAFQTLLDPTDPLIEQLRYANES